MTAKCFHIPPGESMQVVADRSSWVNLIREGRGLIWIDIEQPGPEDEGLLVELGFHRLVVEACISTNPRRPKVDDHGEYLFIVMHGIDYHTDSHLVETAELDVVLGRDFVVSVRQKPLLAIEEAVASLEAGSDQFLESAYGLVHVMFGAIIENLLPTIDVMSDIADAIEDQAIQDPRQETLEAIQTLKRSSLRLQRVLTPEVESLGSLARLIGGPTGEDNARFFEDLRDRANRVAESNNILRERADSALATYLSTVGIQQNQAMKSLAVVATIFFPLSLIAGIYGMNFTNIPELDWEYGYFVVLGIMGTVILGILWGFWMRQYIKAKRVVRIPIAPFAAAAQIARARTHRARR